MDLSNTNEAKNCQTVASKTVRRTPAASPIADSHLASITVMQPLANAVDRLSEGIPKAAAGQLQGRTNAAEPVEMIIHPNEIRADETLRSVSANNKETVDCALRVDQLLGAVYAQQDCKLSAANQISGSTLGRPRAMSVRQSAIQLSEDGRGCITTEHDLRSVAHTGKVDVHSAMPIVFEDDVKLKRDSMTCLVDGDTLFSMSAREKALAAQKGFKISSKRRKVAEAEGKTDRQETLDNESSSASDSARFPDNTRASVTLTLEEIVCYAFGDSDMLRPQLRGHRLLQVVHEGRGDTIEEAGPMTDSPSRSL